MKPARLFVSARLQDAPSEQIEVGSAVAAPFYKLEALAAAFDRAVAPSQRQIGANSVEILLHTWGKGAHDQSFWEPIVDVLLPRTLLLFDLGFLNFTYFDRLNDQTKDLCKA